MTDRMRFTDEQPGGAGSRMLDTVLDRAHRRGHAGMEAIVVAVAGAGAPGVLREHQPACILGVTLAAATAELSHADLLTRWLCADNWLLTAPGPPVRDRRDVTRGTKLGVGPNLHMSAILAKSSEPVRRAATRLAVISVHESVHEL